MYQRGALDPKRCSAPRSYRDADGMVREVRRREIRRQPLAARFGHEERVEARDPVMPFVIWKVSEKLTDSAVGKAPFDDRFAQLKRCHAGAFQFRRDSAEIAEPANERQRMLLLNPCFRGHAHSPSSLPAG